MMIAVTFLLLLISESDEVVSKKYPFVQSKPVKDDMQYEVSYSKEIPALWIGVRDAATFYKLDKTKIDVYANVLLSPL